MISSSEPWSGNPSVPEVSPSVSTPKALRPAVFLDRDGTLIEERNYPCRPEDIVPIAGVGQALHRLAALGFLRVVLTNQSAVARGMLTEESLAELHRSMLRQLTAAGGGVDAIYYCPHHPEGCAVGYSFRCSCRKPLHGLLETAMNEHGIDLARSIFIGDRARDLYADAGPAAARLLVRSGHTERHTQDADAVLPSIVEATQWIAERFDRRTQPPISDTGSEAISEPDPPPTDPALGHVPHEGGTDDPGGPHRQA